MPHLRRVYLLPAGLEENLLAELWQAGTIGAQSSSLPDGRLRLEAWFPLMTAPIQVGTGIELETEEVIPDADWLAAWRERAGAPIR